MFGHGRVPFYPGCFEAVLVVLFVLWRTFMRSFRAILYLQRLGELASQLSDLEDLRRLVEDAERSTHGAPELRRTHHALRRRRSREPGARSVRLRRYARPSRNAGALSSPESDNQVYWTLLDPFPDGWWASP
jgi:hypothetical protein